MFSVIYIIMFTCLHNYKKIILKFRKSSLKDRIPQNYSFITWCSTALCGDPGCKKLD